MEPEIRFFTSAHDGARLAYTEFGSGPPLVQVPRWAHCIEWMTKEPEIGAFYEKLAQRHRVIMLERRGTGASQRDVQDFSMDAHAGDLSSLVQHLKLDRFDLFGAGDSGAVCLTYAAAHSEEVRRLILWGAYAGGLGWLGAGSAARARAALFEHAWTEGAARLTADGIFPLGPLEMQVRSAQLWTEWVPTPVAYAYLSFSATLDAREALPRIVAPTLVLHRKGDAVHQIELSRQIAAGVRDARFVTVEGHAGIAEVEHEPVLAAIEAFLAEDSAQAQRSLASGTAVIMFTDIADSTGLTERMGDAAFRETARSLDSAKREAIREHGGTPVEGKLLGDGVMAVFASAASAIDAARRCLELAGEAGLGLHVGLHAGDVISEGNNVYGGAVNIASRISGLSAPGEILVSRTVRDLARTSTSVSFEDRGEHMLKGVAEPHRLFAVRSPAD